MIPAYPNHQRCSKLNDADNSKQLQNIIKSPKGVSELLKSAAHPVRIQVLALLMQGNNRFSNLMQQTKLSKTALANHIKHLMKMGLIQRISKGEYISTTDGRELLNAAAMVYKNSMQREEDQREALRSRYTRSSVEGKTLNKKLISRMAMYQPCWLSYTGAIAGALKALGTKFDMVDVGGYTGYGFIVNVSKGVTCPSGPTALHLETWKQIIKATENFGWAIQYYINHKSYPEVEGKHTPKEIETTRNLFNKVKREIDEKDRPVVMWGLVIPEYGIINGYEGESYLTSTYRHLTNQPEDPVLFYDLQAPGCLEAFFFKEKIKPDPTQLGKGALERAIQFAEATVPILDNYVAGPKAFNEWACVLEDLPEEKQNYHGNSYVAACVQEGRAISREFLKRFAEKHPGKHADHLLAAARCYDEGAQLMEKFTQIFPFKFQGEMKIKDRKKAAELLREVRPPEEEAISHMKKALKTWDS